MISSFKGQTNNRQVIQCPHCQSKGIKQNICIVDNNTIIITRIEKEEFGTKRKEMTIINAKEFEIICGLCKEPVYKKNGQHA